MTSNTTDLSADSLYKPVHKALSQWGTSSSGNPLGHLRLVERARQDADISDAQASSQVLMQALEALEADNAEYARLLRLRFLDGMSMLHVANRLNRSEPMCYKMQRQAIQRLAAILFQEERTLRAAEMEAINLRLGPPPYDHLFGIDHALNEIMALVQPATEPWLLLLEGIGGIGKTSLADALARRAIATGGFHNIAWVTAGRRVFRLSGRIEATIAPTLTAEELLEHLAEQLLDGVPLPFSIDTVLPMLRQRLNNAPHLIVVDNLETVADLETLLPVLRQLARPAKILLTSRYSLHAETNIYHFPIPELSLAPACQLIRHEARLRNARHLTEADDDVLCPIFETVGGNPLALRLVVGQTLVHDLPTILDSLKAARGQTAEQLYTFIYRQAWDSLDELGQRTLLAMPLAPPQGMTTDLLARITDLNFPDLLDSLDRLVRLNLVDRRGDLQQSRYSIHPLTQTFLQEQVAKWH